MAELCRPRGIRLLVLLHPNRRAFEGDLSFVEPFLSWRARDEEGFARVLDLRSIYAAEGLAWDDFALDKLGHLGPRGHELVARMLARELGG
jgi:hypothetical protein